MNGFGNHRLLESSKFIGAGVTEPQYTMLSLGAFPGVTEGGNVAIHGEIYEVTFRTRDALDSLEGHPSFYKRTPITLAKGGPVEMYILQFQPHYAQHYAHYEQVPTGDWRTWTGGAHGAEGV